MLNESSGLITDPMNLSIRIRRLHSGIRLPAYETSGAAGFDLAAARDVTIEPGAVRLVPTGLVIEVPQGFFLGIFARSSTPLKRGLLVANGVGVVDSDYCGPEDEVKIAVMNFTAAAVQIKAGDRIAQGIVLAAPRVSWEEVDELAATSRGGFGGTGK
jgi:dUTP pyrophosphatase